MDDDDVERSRLQTEGDTFSGYRSVSHDRVDRNFVNQGSNAMGIPVLTSTEVELVAFLGFSE